jgi:hypothetical protein
MRKLAETGLAILCPTREVIYLTQASWSKGLLILSAIWPLGKWLQGSCPVTCNGLSRLACFHSITFRHILSFRNDFPKNYQPYPRLTSRAKKPGGLLSNTATATGMPK